MTTKNRTEIINSFVNLAIKENQFTLAINASELGATQEIIDYLVKACVDNDFFQLGYEAARLGASQKVKESLLKSILSDGTNEKEWDSFAIKTAKLGVSREVIDFLIKALIEKNKDYAFIRIIKEFGITEELINFLWTAKSKRIIQEVI